MEFGVLTESINEFLSQIVPGSGDRQDSRGILVQIIDALFVPLETSFGKLPPIGFARGSVGQKDMAPVWRSRMVAVGSIALKTEHPTLGYTARSGLHFPKLFVELGKQSRPGPGFTRPRSQGNIHSDFNGVHPRRQFPVVSHDLLNYLVESS